MVLDRQLAESGAHVVMAVRNTKSANELIQKWQSEWSGLGLPLNIEVLECYLFILFIYDYCLVALTFSRMFFCKSGCVFSIFTPCLVNCL